VRPKPTAAAHGTTHAPHHSFKSKFAGTGKPLGRNKFAGSGKSAAGGTGKSEGEGEGSDEGTGTPPDSSKHKFTGKCFKCGKVGHKGRFCRSVKDDAEPTAKKAKMGTK
jgi:hypothetical protein